MYVVDRRVTQPNEFFQIPSKTNNFALSGLCVHQAAAFLLSRAFKRSYSSTERTTTTGRRCFSITTGVARAVSTNRPKLYFASRADTVFIAQTAPVDAPFWPSWPF